jgi:hypothetical protein
VINISNFTSKNNPPGRLAEPVRLTPPDRPTRPRAPATDTTERPSPARFGRILASAGRILASAGLVVLSWLAAIPRRLGDRLFEMNDTEAYWRGWQITRTQGGLGRRFRDPQFDTLAECPKCRGAGVTAGGSGVAAGGSGAIAGGSGAIAGLPCLPCLGTGRVTRGEVS